MVLKSFRNRYGKDSITEIHPADEMFNILYNHLPTKSVSEAVKCYLESGEGLLTDLDRIYSDIGFSWGRVGRFLDFACGYGRVTRFLADRLGAQNVVGAEITPDMVEFVTRTFGVGGFVSSPDPSLIDHSGTYDAIYSVSLFSHLSHRVFGCFLGKLYSMLNSGGVLVFSAHGPSAYQMHAGKDWPEKEFVNEAVGIKYMLLNETGGRLDGNIYGTSVVTEEYVRRLVADRGYGTVVRYIPQGIGYFQDAYVIRKM